MSETRERESGPTFADIRAAYRARVFAPSEITFPGESTKLRIRLLTEWETDQARIAAVSHVKEHRIDTLVDSDHVLDREVKRAILWRALLTSSDVKGEQVRFFGVPSELRDDVDTTTLDRLFELYLDHQADVVIDSMPSADTLDQTIGAGLKSAEMFGALLSKFDGPALRALASRMLERIRQKGSAAQP